MGQRLIAMMSEPYTSPDVGVALGRQEKSAENWKTTHEQAFLESGLTWPPNLTRGFLDFRIRREGEVAFFADTKFPASTNEWQFFDALHSFERTFRWPCKPEDLRNPWQRTMPTLCAKSSFVCRKKHTDGSVALKRLLGLEAMRVIGWDKAFWKDGVSPFSNDDRVTPDLLTDLAGNAWSAFSFPPVAIATFACAPWGQYNAAQAARRPTEEQNVVGQDTQVELDDAMGWANESSESETL
jgi:hypothetical protein